MYMLAISDKDGESGKYYSDQILKYASSLSLHQRLNQFEVCLLIDICIKKGTDMHKKKAKAMVDNL